jgi:hypothetical protein
MVFRRSIGVAFHSTERFCAGFFSAGTGVETGSGNAAVFVSAVASEVTASVEGFAAGVVELLTGAAIINGDGGIMMEVASAGPATSGISSAETVGAKPVGPAVTTVGDRVDRISDVPPSDAKTLTTAPAGKG